MRRTAPVALAIVGLAASLASLADAVGDPGFCTAAGCATVRTSAWAHPFGIPLPVLGVAFFATMIAAAFVARPRLRIAGAIAGAAISLALIGIQAFVLHAWCKLCLVADGAALAHLAVLVVARPRPLRWRGLAIVAPLVAGGVLALRVAFAPAVEPPAPSAPIAARAPVVGAVTVVDFVDFECPFCRKQARVLDAAIAAAGVPVRVERVMVPLPMHAGALPAAIAWCCADAQGRGDAMAAALFAADPDDLTRDGCERIAASVGCDLARYRVDRDAPATRARIDRDLAEAREVGVHALPTMVIGGERIVGAALTAPELVAKLRAASV